MKLKGLLLSAALVIGLAPAWVTADEPNVQIASQWWPELTNVLTPVAWRDHPHRFCVVYDGTLMAMPEPQQLLQYERRQYDPTKRAFDGVQLGFIPSADGAVPPERNDAEWLSLPDGKRYGDQGWLPSHAAPVLWTRWKPASGLTPGATLRQLVFSHMAGGGEAKRGDEPMFAWIRLEVAEVPSSRPPEARTGFLVKIAAPHLDFGMAETDNCRTMPDVARYPRTLHFEPAGTGGAVLEEDGRVRLMVLAGEGVSAKFLPQAEGQRGRYLHVTFPQRPGTHADLLVPMVPAPRPIADAEVSLGYDGALAQTDRFWSQAPPTVATVHTPEPLVNGAISRGAQMARMLSLTLPQTRQRALLSGAMFYSYHWTTPTSMTKHMLLDPLGWHDDVDKYIEIYRAEQGRMKPPGPDFAQHPGYFGTPAALDSGNHWLTDHGSVLHAVSRHALLTGDEAFTRRWLDSIVKACDFIKDARRLPRRSPAAQGVMPPAEASDISRPMQAFWSDGWNYKALVTAARLLRTLGHPRADEFEREAADYRAAIAAAFRAKAARMSKWTDASGRQRTIAPMTLATDDSDGLGHAHPFYLDCGPMFGAYAGVLAADDPLMRDACDFFREGPHGRPLKDVESWSDKPHLVHEMSSAEPCYSWNVFHSHQLADRRRYLEGMYSLFTGALARTTHVSCETRGGITENVFATTLAVALARLAAVDDEVEPGSLHLLRLVPLAWVSESEETRFENMPTEFGPVTLKWRLADGGKTLDVSYSSRFRRQPQSVLLHAPPVPGLSKLVVNGREVPVDPGKPVKL